MNCTFVMCIIPRHANCNYGQRVNLLGVLWCREKRNHINS